MTAYIDREALQPLLDVIDRERDPALRLAAVDAVAQFPLDEEGWFELAVVVRDLIFDLPAGSAERREALRIAAAIPLLSVRRQLRRMVDDPHEPDAGAVADALSSVGDPSQIERLAARIRGGEVHRLPDLAAMPLEDSGLGVDDVPVPGETEDPTLALWYALAVARLGERGPLDAYLAGEVDPPPLFWSSPWNVYDRLAVVRPLPGDLDAHLRAALAGTDRIDDGERRSMARMIVWACTGLADAEGNPLEEAVEPGPAAATAPPSGRAPVPPGEAASAAERIAATMSGFAQLSDAPAGEEVDRLAGLAPGDANRFLVELIAGANRRVAVAGSTGLLETHLGNALIGIVSHMPVNPGWPVRELAAGWLAPGPRALDLGQLAWVIARPAVGRVSAELASGLGMTASAADRRRLLELLGEVGRTLAGRAGSPYRGAGPGSGAPPPRPALIDDEPEMAMRGGVELPAAAPAPSGAEAPLLEEAAPEASGAEPPETVEAVADERRVNAQIRALDAVRDTFLAGARNTIRCWIGLPEPDRAAVSDADIAHLDHIPDEGLELDVQLEWDGQSATTRTRLPPDRTARTGDCDLAIDVPEGERYIKADVAFLYRGRVFEHVRMEAAVLAEGEVAQPRDRLQVRVQTRLRQVIELEDRSRVDATLIVGEDAGGGPGVTTLLEFGSQGIARYSLDSTGTAVSWLNEELFIADKNLVRSRADSGDARPLLAADDPDVLTLLRHLAQHGAGFYNQLVGQRFADPGRRLQLLNRTPREYVPLEFVYDRGYPAGDATLCDGWREALSGDEDECPCCGPPPPPHDDARDNAPTICPMGFWSLKKIIERLDPMDGVAGTGGRSVPRTGRRDLAPIDRVLFGASHRVKQEDRDATVATLRKAVGTVDLADDWPTWKTAIRQVPVPLLLALPHHGTKNNQDYLEIGGAPTPEADRELESGRLTNGYVNPNNVHPGPIVLLIGCETGAGTSTGYPTLARTFQQLHTSIVVGTLAKVLGRHAAPVAQELVSQLATVDDPDMDFGTIMRRVRRRMLLKGYLMALCIVALGDADWHLARRAHEPVRAGDDTP